MKIEQLDLLHLLVLQGVRDYLHIAGVYRRCSTDCR